jgi:hypothetical protein
MNTSRGLRGNQDGVAVGRWHTAAVAYCRLRAPAAADPRGKKRNKERLRGHNSRRLPAVRCVSAGAERREGVLCVVPAYVVSPQAKKKKKKKKKDTFFNRLDTGHDGRGGWDPDGAAADRAGNI